MQQLQKYGPVLGLIEWLRYFMFDTLSLIAFNEDLGPWPIGRMSTVYLPGPKSGSTTSTTG
jgi:hypothetical protein